MQGKLETVSEGVSVPPALRRSNVVVALWRGLRPKQWIKNLLVFAGLVFTLNERWRFFTPEMWRYLARSSVAFVLFSLISSTVYLLNDVRDVEKDRRHPVKRNRPVASGALPPWMAVTAALTMMPLLLTAACFLRRPCFIVEVSSNEMKNGYNFQQK